VEENRRGSPLNQQELYRVRTGLQLIHLIVCILRPFSQSPSPPCLSLSRHPVHCIPLNNLCHLHLSRYTTMSRPLPPRPLSPPCLSLSSVRIPRASAAPCYICPPPTIHAFLDWSSWVLDLRTRAWTLQSGRSYLSFTSFSATHLSRMTVLCLVQGLTSMCELLIHVYYSHYNLPYVFSCTRFIVTRAQPQTRGVISLWPISQNTSPHFILIEFSPVVTLFSHLPDDGS